MLYVRLVLRKGIKQKEILIVGTITSVYKVYFKEIAFIGGQVIYAFFFLKAEIEVFNATCCFPLFLILFLPVVFNATWKRYYIYYIAFTCITLYIVLLEKHTWNRLRLVKTR